jgi:hypothetical protein
MATGKMSHDLGRKLLVDLLLLDGRWRKAPEIGLGVIAWLGFDVGPLVLTLSLH